MVFVQRAPKKFCLLVNRDAKPGKLQCKRSRRTVSLEDGRILWKGCFATKKIANEHRIEFEKYLASRDPHDAQCKDWIIGVTHEFLIWRLVSQHMGPGDWNDSDFGFFKKSRFDFDSYTSSYKMK